jgi:hypothetical protein
LTLARVLKRAFSIFPQARNSTPRTAFGLESDSRYRTEAYLAWNQSVRLAQHFLTPCVSYSCGHNRSEEENKTQGDPMTSQWKNALLSAALVTLAIPVVAQNAPDPAPRSEVGQRQENQQDRIAQGVKSGQLTAGETQHLEKNEARINREVRNDRAANGGKLTPEEKAKVNHQLNRQSRQIYRDKHNAAKQ